MSLTVGSLFSAIGGLDLGLERAGMQVKWQVEIDEYCQRVLAKHWPAVERYRDVRDVSARTVPPVDLLCGGLPCQPVSLAGRRAGQSDSRWLWPEAARLVDELRPAIVLLENVPGILSLGGAEVAADLATLGYDAAWHCFPASALGAWHRRERWWCVAADTESVGWDEGRAKPARQQGRFDAAECRPHTAYAQRPRLEVRKVFGDYLEQELASTLRSHRTCGGVWEAEPKVGRLAHGVPHRVAQLRGLGNAVVPQVAEFIGRRILASLETGHDDTE